MTRKVSPKLTPYERTGRRVGTAFLIAALAMMLAAFFSNTPVLMLAGLIMLVAAVLTFPS